MVKGRRGRKEKKRNATNEEEGTRNRERGWSGGEKERKIERRGHRLASVGVKRSQQTHVSSKLEGCQRSSCVLLRFCTVSTLLTLHHRSTDSINLEAGKCEKKKCRERVEREREFSSKGNHFVVQHFETVRSSGSGGGGGGGC